MMEKAKDKMWLTTKNPAIIFEDNTVGHLKKRTVGCVGGGDRPDSGGLRHSL